MALLSLGASPPQRRVPVTGAPTSDSLQSACTPAGAQAIAASLGAGVTVKHINNSPMGAPFADGINFIPATGGRPALCQITGSFVTNPATGKTANFLATLPENWNGKYLQVGCSGHCGQFAVSNPAFPTVAATYPGDPKDLVTRGYAIFGTDEGHEGLAGGTWAIKGPGQVDEDAIEDWGWRADKVLATMGKRFTLAFYGQFQDSRPHISRSYFSGCSGGGRDALVAASYFPEQFDGIIAGSPYAGASTNFQFAGISLASLRSDAAVIPPSLVRLIDPIVKARCDKLDGVEDGLIQNPAACDFRPERDLPLCKPGSAEGQCFTPAQIETLSVAITAVTDEQGNVVQPGMPVSEITPNMFVTPKRPADLAANEPFPGSDNGDSTGNGYWPLADAFFKVFVHRNDPEFHTRSLFTFRSGGPGTIGDYRAFVSKAEVELVHQRARQWIGHYPENLRKFLSGNRKLLLWHNYSDNTLTPYASVNYYKSLARLNGGYARLRRNARLFSLPGTPHCGLGGIGPNSFDALTAMENWVEKGIAPDALPAWTVPTTPPYGLKNFNAPRGRSMPLCAFPEMARYKGTGDVKDAANWTCDSKDTRLLAIGESGRRAGVIQ